MRLHVVCAEQKENGMETQFIALLLVDMHGLARCAITAITKPSSHFQARLFIVQTGIELKAERKKDEYR